MEPVQEEGREPPFQNSEAPALELPGSPLRSQKLYLLPRDDGSLIELVGDQDLTNRYASAVMIPSDESESALSYHSGQVRLHPKFKIIFDARGNAETSHADLAVILLEEPVDPSIPPARLTETGAQLDELLVIAGYGYEAGVMRIHGTRFFKRSKVRRLPAPPDDKFVSEPRGIHFTSGYRGGPCLREPGKDPWLVGIVGLGDDEKLSCTSTSLYLPWLHTQIQEAKGR